MNNNFLIRQLIPALSEVQPSTGYVSLSELKKLYNASPFDPEIMSQVNRQIHLVFDAQNKPGNVCFANHNDDLRDEFKQVYSALDICDYIVGYLASNGTKFDETPWNEFLESPVHLPENADEFWSFVHQGAQVRLAFFAED